MVHISNSRREMQQVAADFIQKQQPRTDMATIVTLSGDLGAGKTTFAQGVARGLGVDETVTSPTFVIEKIYGLTGQKFARFVHVDAYRLESAHELEVLGWREIAHDPSNLIVVEWPEKVAELIPKDATMVRFDIDGEKRIISINDGEESL